MIPIDFQYVTAHSVTEAIRQYNQFSKSDMSTRYYSGGTEIITLARLHQLTMDAVIDIKPIPAAQVFSVVEEKLFLGAALTLSQITSHPMMSSAFPLLQATVNEIADQTARNKITLGGNLCGDIIYREAVLPLLVCDSKVRIAGPNGAKEEPIHRIFRRTMQLKPGEFIVQIATDKIYRCAPFFHVKRRKMGEVGYPIVSAAAIRVHGNVRIALSGVCPFPFRSRTMEHWLNQKHIPVHQRVEEAIRIIPQEFILNDYEASREYRRFVLRTVLEETLHQLGSA
ncbi:xanthine dehydrogenase [Alicyclobacillus acidoterrestris]|nr:xanthine dehydrogenase [Alicyclobacillus acidoterrestris]